MTKTIVTIGLNGCMLDDQPTGVGTYSFNLINNLYKLYRNDEYLNLTVFTPTRSFLNKNLKIVKLSNFLQSSRYGKLAALTRFIWNAFFYPFQAHRHNLLISPSTHGNFLSNNQIITIHDLISLRYNNISGHQRLYFKYLLPFLLRRAKRVVAVSNITKQDIIHYFKIPEDKIEVIHNGYDHENYYPVKESTGLITKKYGVQNYLLAVGPTYAHKNFETLIKAYKALGDAAMKQFPLAIAGGKKEYVNHLKQLVFDLDLKEHVHFLGYVPIQLMPSLYRESIMLIFPSLYEGFGIPLLEAMACGCPIIASNTSSVPEVCGDAVLYIDPKDHAALTVQIEKLIADESLRNNLIIKGLIQAKKFSWEQTAKSLKNLIDKQLN